MPNSVLFLGRPGVGKTTVIREMARVLSGGSPHAFALSYIRFCDWFVVSKGVLAVYMRSLPLVFVALAVLGVNGSNAWAS